MSGYLQLGTAVSGTVVVTPGSGLGYAGQPVSFTAFPGGVQLNSVNCVFGPVSGSWGTLTCFGVTSDQAGTVPVQAPGTLTSPFTPLNGQLVAVPPGNVQLVVGAQFAAGPGTVVAATGVASGPTVSGYVALASGAYSAVLASGARNALTLQNMSATDTVKIVLGGGTAPASGAVPSAVLPPPFGSWPPAGTGFVTTDSVWATCGAASGTNLSYVTG
jgi:hypothetical protein